MKRSALCVWRCAGATSPGMMSCRPAYKDCVTAELPLSAGFSMINTLRTASAAVIAVPARIRKGLTCSYCHSAATQGVLGCSGTKACSTSHSGVRCSGAMSVYNAWRSSCLAASGVSGAFMVIPSMEAAVRTNYAGQCRRWKIRRAGREALAKTYCPKAQFSTRRPGTRTNSKVDQCFGTIATRACRVG